MQTVFIVDEIRSVVEKTNTQLTADGFDKTVYYDYGHPKEINERLTELSKSPTEKAKKWPRILLITDVPITRNIPGMYGAARMQIIICNYTEPTYTAQQRTDTNFKPVLHPIKEVFLRKLSEHRLFSFEEEPTFVETDCYYYGSRINDKNVFADRIDAIELSNLLVYVSAKIC